MKSGVAKTFLLVGVPAALGVVALIFGAMEFQRFLSTSAKFAVNSVEVVTKGAADDKEIIRLAAINPGTNIFALDLEEIRQRVEREPWVQAATVVRALPNKIQISYRSQVPKAILGADSMYYLNSDGVPFYRLQKGDSLAYPLIQVEGKSKDKEMLRGRVAASVGLLERLKQSSLYSEKDLGDLTIRTEAENGSAPFLLTLRFPPQKLTVKKPMPPRLYTVSFGESDPTPQVKYWEAVVRYLAQQGKNPRLIRLELGKKVVVKLEK